MALADDDDSGLEGNVDELLISAIKENEKLRNKIISLKVENEEIRRREDLLEAKLKEKEETCEECKTEIVSLRKELEQIKKGCKSSQILETILKNQKPQHDKSRIGFKGESSSTKNNVKSYVDELSYNPKDEKCTPNPKNEERITPKKNMESNHGHYSKYKPVLHQGPIKNPKNEGEVIPRKEIDSNHGCFNKYKTIFLGHCFHCKNFGHQARHCIYSEQTFPIHAQAYPSSLVIYQAFASLPQANNSFWAAHSTLINHCSSSLYGC